MLWDLVPFQSAMASGSFLLPRPQVGDFLGGSNLLWLTTASPKQRWTMALVQATHRHFLMTLPFQLFLWAYAL